MDLDESHSPQPSGPTTHKYACNLCARRKVRCNKADPCSNCARARVECLYPTVPPARPRKRPADDDLRTKLVEYEYLLRKHRIDFEPCTHVWIQSGLEQQAKDAITGTTHTDTPPHSIRTEETAATDGSKTLLDSRSSSFSPRNTTWEANTEESLWASLPPELRFPPMLTFSHDLATHVSSEDGVSDGSWIRSVFLSSASAADPRELHPEPKHILKLWHIFVERVNPLSKVVHIPSLQPKILEASFDMHSISESLQALIFGIYTLSVTALSPQECETMLRESRGALLARYKPAAFRSLMAADLFATRDLEVLQAFTLFLLADPQSDLTTTLGVVAVRLGQKMAALDAYKPPTFFEQEMRTRLFWQIRQLVCIRRQGSPSSPTTSSEVPSTATYPTPPDLQPPSASSPHLLDFASDLRLPLNLNDADLHPDMTAPPMEHAGPTEMLYVLLRYETANWLRTSPLVAQVIAAARGELLAQERQQQQHYHQQQRPQQTPTGNRVPSEIKERAITDLRALLTRKYLSRCDPRVPLHALAVLAERLVTARMRFKAGHPRLGTVYLHVHLPPEVGSGPATAAVPIVGAGDGNGEEVGLGAGSGQGSGSVYASLDGSAAGSGVGSVSGPGPCPGPVRVQEECAVVFENGVELLELGMELQRRGHFGFAPGLLARMTSRPSVEAYVYVISELRRRVTGEKVAAAWAVVEALFEEHPEIVEDGENAFYVALGDLVLDAWAARRAALVIEGEVVGEPVFVQRLRAVRMQKEVEEAGMALGDGTVNFDMNGGMDMGWDYWNDVFQIL